MRSFETIGGGVHAAYAPEVYAADDGKRKFTRDFIKAWTTVMMRDRVDVDGI